MISKKKIILSGHYGFDSLGDEAFLSYMVTLFKRNNIEPLVLSSNPSRTERLYEVKSINRTDLKSLKKAMKEADGILLGGSSRLGNSPDKKDAAYYFLITFLAAANKKPVYFFGQGIGELQKTSTKMLLKRTLSLASSVSVRDEATKNYLQNEIKFKKRDVHVVHNPALFTPMASENGYLLTAQEKEVLKKGPVFLSISNSSNDLLVEHEVRLLLEHLQKRKIPVISFGLSQEDVDITRKTFKDFENCVFIDRPIDVDSGTYIIKNSRLLIGMRLHSLVLAASQATPLLGISSNAKVDSFLATLDEQVICEAPYIDAEKVILKTEHLLKNEIEKKNVIKQRVSALKTENEKHERQLIQTIHGGSYEKEYI